MNNNEILHIYDQNLNMTLSELSQITGKTIKQLKKILLGSK